MHILVITDKLYPDEFGGSCTVAYQLIKHWEATGNVVNVFTCHPSMSENNNFFKGIIKRAFDKKNIVHSAYSLDDFISSSGPYDAIVCHSALSCFILKLSKSRIKLENVYFVFHGPWNKEAVLKYQGQKKYLLSFLLPPVYKYVEKKAIKFSPNLIFLSDYMKNEANAITSLKNKRITIIPGGVDCSFFHRSLTKNQAKEKLHIPSSKFVFFSLRRLDKRMGLQLAIQAFKQLPKTIRNNSIYIIGGKGEYKPTLEKMIGNDDSILLKGYISDEDIVTFYSAADLFLVPTTNLEGFGLVNLESLSIGTPVLATPQGGMISIKGYFNNFYLANNISSKGLCESMEFLYEKIQKKTVSYDDSIKKFDWSIIAERYIEVFMRK